MAKEPNALAGHIIGKVDCQGCRKIVAVKVNRNGIAYANCMWPDSETGELCGHQTRYSRKYSNALIARHNKPEPQPQPEKIEHDREPKQPARRDEPKPATDEGNFLGL